VPGERGQKAQVRVETILSGTQANRLRREGVDLQLKTIDGQTAAERATAQAAEGYEVFRTYGGADGLKAEFEQMAAANPGIAKLVPFGQTVNNQDIVALKVSNNARKLKDGTKPSVLYLAAQHAREWITPEMVRRLAHHFLDGYGSDRQITRLVNTTELWFVPVANPDGYDFTFTPGNRLWRKNLRDNNGDGVITPGDGVDLNRNFATKWGYDNEGSSDNPASETYRGTGPNSEPEDQALEDLAGRVGFEFFVNYHSAAELLLYGTGWQVSTPTPDDVIYEAMAGDDANPAVPGYDPDISAELYTTNGDTDTHLTELFGTLGFTPEMATCETASQVDPDDEWVDTDCDSGFNFPDDEGLVQAEFEKNIPFALSVAESASDPDDPESVVGRTAEDFRVDSFDVSYGDPQTVAVVAKRALKNMRLRYSINGGPAQTARVSEWAGGERYGDENDDYYAEFRGQVRGASPGDEVEVWFTGVNPDASPVTSDSFTYTLESDTGNDVLVIANEDYTGVDPEYPASVTAPKYDETHVQALEDAGYTADVWDVDAQGVPHDLGVLGHYDAVLWYLGDNRLTADPEDLLTQTPLGNLPSMAVAERQQYLTMAVRDYLNAGGKLVHAGESAQHQGLEGLSTAVGGLYYGLNGDETADCVIEAQPNSQTAGFFEDCLIMADDFRQYYLGGFTRTNNSAASGVTGVAEPLDGFTGTFAAGDNPLDEAGVYQPTSEVLPPDEFPQFTSHGSVEYVSQGQDPYAPVEGTRYAGALHQDASYMRLQKTVDLTGATAAQLQFQLSIDTEPQYDNVIVEAHTVGQDNWTTLPDLNGGTQTDPPAECAEGGFLLQMHPFLSHYLGGADCTAPGTSGTWNSFTSGSTAGGWHQAAVDLSGFAGDEVEVAISYVTDPNTGGVGAFVDDTHVVVDGADEADGFEGATSTWTASGPPPGSAPNAGNWQISEKLVTAFAGTSTEDTLLLGFGLEQLSTEPERADLLERALGALLQ
ncbi:MAG: M14 family zinc carboxypeptidase, partial [Actinomycetes bacterium]